jgi:hypothetical protein
MSTTLRVAIDAIEVSANDIRIASLVTDNGARLTLPTALLPDGAIVGDVLMISIARDPAETAARAARVSELQRKLFE